MRLLVDFLPAAEVSLMFAFLATERSVFSLSVLRFLETTGVAFALARVERCVLLSKSLARVAIDIRPWEGAIEPRAVVDSFFVSVLEFKGVLSLAFLARELRRFGEHL